MKTSLQTSSFINYNYFYNFMPNFLKQNFRRFNSQKVQIMQIVNQNPPPPNAINSTPAARQPSYTAELSHKATAEPVKEINMRKLLASCCDCV
jgi:hypothetical protein